MVAQIVLALNASIGDLTDLLAVKALPTLAIELLVKLKDEDWVHKIDECIAYIAFVL